MVCPAFDEPLNSYTVDAAPPVLTTTEIRSTGADEMKVVPAAVRFFACHMVFLSSLAAKVAGSTPPRHG